MTTLLMCELRDGVFHPAVPRVMTAANTLGPDTHVLVAAEPSDPAVARLAPRMAIRAAFFMGALQCQAGRPATRVGQPVRTEKSRIATT